MTDLFISLLDMSLTASYVATAVIILRIFLKKAPKIFSYVLWLPVLLRLVLPFSISSRLSLIGVFDIAYFGGKGTINAISENTGFILDRAAPAREGWINSANEAASLAPSAGVFPGVDDSFAVRGFFLQAASVIWLAGIAVLVIFSIISYLKVAERVSTATVVNDNIFESDRISSPFVYGFLNPRIYIPVGLIEPYRTYILTHEQTHIKRLDYLIKPFAFLVLTLHWFNPLMWLSFILMSRDMEMSCDESVVRRMGSSIKANYSNSLLSFSVRGGGFVLGSPLAFGESALKARIKNVLNYKRPAFWVTTLIIVLITAFIAGFATNPEKTLEKEVLTNKYKVEQLLKNKTPYVGDNSKVVGLIDALKLPVGLSRNTVVLQTEAPPLGIRINLNMRDYSGMLHDGAISGSALFPDAVLLFSLIGNVDKIEFKIADKTGKYDGVSYGFTFTRAEVEKLMGEDVRTYSENVPLIQELIDKVTIMNVYIKKNNYTGKLTEDDEKLEKIKSEIEPRLDILTQASTSSNPGDYIKAHPKEYEDIIKMGDQALEYLLAQFRENKVGNDLRGYIVMSLCKELLGSRSSSVEDSLTPAEWYSKVSLRKQVPLGDFKARSSDPVEQAIYQAVSAHYSDSTRGFNVVAPTILGTYEEKDKLKVFVTVLTSYCKLYDKTVTIEGSSIIPAAITFSKDTKGGYITETFVEAKDGAYFTPSIAEFCKLPVSKKKIRGLDEKILKDYSNHDSRQELLISNLIQHLKDNQLLGISLEQPDGKLQPLT